jgi:hypothetical protein
MNLWFLIIVATIGALLLVYVAPSPLSFFTLGFDIMGLIAICSIAYYAKQDTDSTR